MTNLPAKMKVLLILAKDPSKTLFCRKLELPSNIL